MRASDALLLEAAYASWAARDLDLTLACFAEDVEFAIHVPQDVVPFAGRVHGKAALARQLSALLDFFDFIEYKPVQITAEGGSFHSQVRFHFRHKATGYTYEGTMRHVWRIGGDKIVQFEEFHDVDRVRAFFQLIASDGGSS